jgi:hypothetical protein
LFQIISGTSSKTVSGTQNLERNVPNTTAHKNVPNISLLFIRNIVPTGVPCENYKKTGGSALGTRRTYATPEGHLDCMQCLIIVRGADYCNMVDDAANNMAAAIKCTVWKDHLVVCVQKYHLVTAEALA